MKKPVMLIESPNRPNIGYVVKVASPDPSKTFQTVVKNLREQKGNYKRTIVYCQSITVTQPYGFFQAELGKDIYADETIDPRKRFVEMFHSRIDELNWEQTATDGCVRWLYSYVDSNNSLWHGNRL